MVLCPIVDPGPAADDLVIGAWSAVERRQQLPASRWLLIPQAEHAEISGQIAARFDAPGFPAPPPEVVRAIGLHDAGWSRIEGGEQVLPAVHGDGRPMSFFEIAPETFLGAWEASIERAARDSEVGAYIVSRHFSTLGQFRIERAQDPPETMDRLRDFVAREQVRQAECNRDARKNWETFVTLLKFCDILSLYVCSGATQSVEFPQSFAAGKVRARRHRDVVSLDPSPLREPVQISLKTRDWPPRATAPVRLELVMR